MKKLFIWLLIAVFAISMAFVGIGCKKAEEAAPAEEAEEVEAEEAAPAELVDMIFITPRGTAEVMDDYYLWVAKEMGYFEELGINIIVEPGPMDAFACTKFIDSKKADVTVPSPGILCSSIDTGMDVIMIYAKQMTNVFDFAVRKDSDIESVQDIEGKTISLGDPGWQVIVDPILVEIGVPLDSVTYVSAGAQWGQAVSLGEADVALCWRGLRAQWDAIGLDLKYFLGDDFSELPANGIGARKSDLTDPDKRQLLIDFLEAVTMAVHFTRFNPRAAAQITYDQFAAVREQMEPALALESMGQLHWGYCAAEREGGGYGWFEEDDWQKYCDIIYELGQTENHLKFEEVGTNELIKEATDFDRDRVEEDAMSYELNDIWKDVEVKGDFNW